VGYSEAGDLEPQPRRGRLLAHLVRHPAALDNADGRHSRSIRARDTALVSSLCSRRRSAAAGADVAALGLGDRGGVRGSPGGEGRWAGVRQERVQAVAVDGGAGLLVGEDPFVGDAGGGQGVEWALEALLGREDPGVAEVESGWCVRGLASLAIRRHLVEARAQGAVQVRAAEAELAYRGHGYRQPEGAVDRKTQGEECAGNPGAVCGGGEIGLGPALLVVGLPVWGRGQT
jgi:hypothetical protein